jgi:hypothetical protein
VPTPEKVLGYVIGTPGKLTKTAEQAKYYRELAKASPRVKVLVAPEKSEEGREQLLVLVSDEENLAKLDTYKSLTAKLADPRKITDDEAKTVYKEAKPFYWASGSIHSTETGSPEMLMEMAYRLAVEETPHIQAIRKNVIVMITPTLEVDGRDRMVDLYNWRTANKGKPSPSLLYWGKYVAHDNNRDSMGMALALSRNQMKTFLEYHPQVLHDLHESVPFLYTSTGTGPYNAWLDPIVIDEWHVLAYHEIEQMTKRGVPGVWTHGFYDGWAANYMFYVANGHNSIGRFYETFGNGGADTQDRTVGAQAQRDWFRPNPPLSRVKWSQRNNINMQQSALLIAMKYVAEQKERFLENFYLKSKRSVQKAQNEGPFAYVIPGDTPRPLEAADLVNLLRMQGVEVHRLTAEFNPGGQEGLRQAQPPVEQEEQDPGARVGGQRVGRPTGSGATAPAPPTKFPAGSYVVRMDQPYSRMADMLLDKQFYNVNDPSPYDDTGWTLGPLHNVKTVRLTDKAILTAPMLLLTSDAKVEGGITGQGSTILVNHTAESALATLRYRLKDVGVEAAEKPFEAGGIKFNAGSLVLKANSPEERGQIETVLKETGFKGVAVEKAPEVAKHKVGLPRIALVHTWTNTQNEGWYRIELDRYQIPYSYVSVHALRDTGDLRKKYDVIIFGPVGGSAQSIVNGISKDGDPIPWKKSTLTPSFDGSPDQTDNMRGGIELKGMLNLQKFVEEGGLFITVGRNASLPIDYGLVSGVSIQDADKLQTQGSVFHAEFADRNSPISYGYDETMAVYLGQATLFGAGVGGRSGNNAPAGPSRPSGRGDLNDPDIPQGRPMEPPRAAGFGAGDFGGFQGLQGSASSRPRTILRFGSDAKSLLISGMLAGSEELAGKPAIIDAPVGKGHIVMFANNPMWRHETQGSHALLFNAILHFDHLGVGRGR